MDLSLYHPRHGYYSRLDHRSGQTGDFFTSVDLGTIFGELLAEQFAEMSLSIRRLANSESDLLMLIEAGAGNGALASDVLDATAKNYPELYKAIQLTLVEQSATARASHIASLGTHTKKLSLSTDTLPNKITGIIYANELLDALPVHRIVMTESGLKEVYVDLDSHNEERFVERLGPPSSVVLEHIDRFGITLESGWRAEISPASVRWMEQAGRALDLGFLVLIDYGHAANQLYSATHASGTLATYERHVISQPQAGMDAAWLLNPGSVDITAQVDLTAVQQAAESVGLETLTIVDQTYFLLGLSSMATPTSGNTVQELKRRLALKTLLLPGGLGSSHKVMIFGKNVGRLRLRASSFSTRTT
tara:strand:- start:4040 stop:5125 length:1086 start_codon:yes stop_codon:yes gene_type:complete